MKVKIEYISNVELFQKYYLSTVMKYNYSSVCVCV